MPTESLNSSKNFIADLSPGFEPSNGRPWIALRPVAEIEQAVAKLSAQEFIEFERWFDEERNRKWDRQIEADTASGALDFLLHEVDEDIA